MTKPNDEQALPHPSISGALGRDVPAISMTLRDYFAGQAISAVLEGQAQMALGGLDVDTTNDTAAQIAYKIADAMLEER